MAAQTVPGFSDKAGKALLSSDLVVESNIKSMDPPAKQLRAMAMSSSETEEEQEQLERQRWLPGPPEPMSFLLLVDNSLLSKLGFHSLCSDQPLNGIGWILAEGPMLEVVLEAELS
jgi:hypothetical protein